jgi:predicted DNA-binding protein YlxM (UPF0122 family)
MSMLLDFYGGLLTEKQSSCVNMYYNEDLSLGEISEIMNISRQGVRDLLVRAEATLLSTEKKLGSLARFERSRQAVKKMSLELAELIPLSEGRALELALSLQKELQSVDLI